MDIPELKNKLSKSVDFLKTEFSQIRTGRANPSLVEDIEVVAYESKMMLKELGSITLQDAQTILITPWDKNLANVIAKAIRESKLSLNPVEDSGIVRIPIPALTEERRVELAKLVSQKAEETKVSMRSIRQEAMKDIDNLHSDKEISDDKKFAEKERVEEMVKEFVEQIEKVSESKKKDLMRV
ncbi:ribosome recycling factor [Patescibacteria group bacterium]